jgi:hypothetical protein
MTNKKDESSADQKATVTLPGTVEKIIPSIDPEEPEKAQIAVEGAEDLYREIRIDNTLQDGNGNVVSLKKGAEVEVTIAADSEATTKIELESRKNFLPVSRQKRAVSWPRILQSPYINHGIPPSSLPAHAEFPSLKRVVRWPGGR